MSDNELPITPDALRTYMDDENDDLLPFNAVHNIAAPVVAAELRRIADIWDGLARDASGELDECIDLLRGRADYLHAEEDA